MSIIQLIFVLVIIGVALWLMETYVPMLQPIKILIYVLVAIFVIVVLLGLVGIDTGLRLGI